MDLTKSDAKLQFQTCFVGKLVISYPCSLPSLKKGRRKGERSSKTGFKPLFFQDKFENHWTWPCVSYMYIYLHKSRILIAHLNVNTC